MMTTHVFPVPTGYTPQDAWAEIATFGHLYQRVVLPDGTGGSWAIAYVYDDGRIEFEEADAPPG